MPTLAVVVLIADVDPFAAEEGSETQAHAEATLLVAVRRSPAMIDIHVVQAVGSRAGRGPSHLMSGP